MKTLSLLLLLCAPAFASAQCHHIIVDNRGVVWCNMTCSPGRQVLVSAPVKPNDTPQAAELKKVYSQIVNNDVLLRQALKHSVPEYRFTAIYAIAIKKLPKHEELIELLSDPHPSVQLAARQALGVLTQKYGKREDFGPLARASFEQVAESQREWRKWFEARKEHIAATAAMK